MTKNKDINSKKSKSSKKKKVEKVLSKSDLTDKNKAKIKISLKDQLANEKDKNLRLFAEFENYKKRTSKERIELFTTANKDIMTVLLPIMDNFERSIKANNYKNNDGPVLIYKQLKTELEKQGLSEIENPIGKTLDTDFHEATAQIPSTNEKDKDKIIDVIEKGYLLGGKILRYAKVVVAK